MDIARPVQSSTLQVECPQCGHPESDDYDVLDINRVVELRCVECRSAFAAAVMECAACGEEALFCWRQKPARERMCVLRCLTCGDTYRDHETLSAAPARSA